MAAWRDVGNDTGGSVRWGGTPRAREVKYAIFELDVRCRTALRHGQELHRCVRAGNRDEPLLLITLARYKLQLRCEEAG